MALVKIHGITKEYPEGTTWAEVAREHQKEYEYDILLVRVSTSLPTPAWSSFANGSNS